ncbi:helix-turn-helix domain-containing protein (plasmid) [Rhizobium lusitanum]|uniref:helix-turn-helix domain-containing protein n=1 Tax=Rhizobium lusitanum TaxID=293958 RepID=UPI00161312A6|nr:XRE family transcriptional regulator [Rhizobium lusitanum]QND46332.1 helix-turn-helix domain-containing protein [Rhizobium lusitanum]
MSNILHSQERGDVLAHVSGNLRRLRKSVGLSQTALAEASGISRRMIIAVEAGDANISLSSLDKLAAALGVDFVDLVRDPTRASRADINQVTWRGKDGESLAVLLGSAPASTEAQMWLWALGPGDRYDAEPDPQGWHEMIYVTEGALRLELSGEASDYKAGTFAVYSTAQNYSYINPGETPVRFVRNVIS